MPLIVAIDLQPMAPIEGVIQVQGDITNARTAEIVRISYISTSLALHFFILFVYGDVYWHPFFYLTFC